MNCQEIQQQLNEYLDGDLTADERQQCRKHLEDCPDCRLEFEGLQAILTGASELPREIQPAHDLWPGILARIAAKPATGRSWWLQLAAAGIALAVLSIPLSVWWTGQQDGDDRQSLHAVSVEDEVSDRAQVARSEDGVLLARTDLVTAIERHRDVLEDETLQILEENMGVLDQAIGELRTALDEDPQNLRLRMLLASRYQQERKLLQKVSRV